MKVKNNRFILESYIHIGEILQELKKLKMAKEYTYLGLNLAVEIDDRLNQRDCYYKLANIEYQLGNYKVAYELREKYDDLDTEILGEKTRKKIMVLEKKYEFSDLRKEKELLKRQNKIQKLEIIQNNNNITFLYFLVAFGVVLVIIVVMYYKKKKLRYQYQLNLFHQQSLKAQVNPHFMFNVLNSIQSQIMSGNADNASLYLGDFSKLMRKNLDSFSESFISLKEEMEIIVLYLKLEKIRFKNRLNYEIKIDENIDVKKIQILPMLLQPLVENAVLHGLSPLEAGGDIMVTVCQPDTSLLKITIDDNGVGYPKIKHKSSSKGITLTKNRLKLWNGSNSFLVQNKQEFGEKGTLVTINVVVS